MSKHHRMLAFNHPEETATYLSNSRHTVHVWCTSLHQSCTPQKNERSVHNTTTVLSDEATKKRRD